MTLVSSDWLNENLNKVKIIDASWHLIKNRNAIEEYNKEHIKNAIFFDLDKNSNQRKDLPHQHFLPSLNEILVILSPLLCRYSVNMYFSPCHHSNNPTPQ